ncbi:cytochrome b/b6 domain-containing protein [Rhodanobacter denitrificans]|uniref:cytochrome b/b6 domain-containing protein n=1 Tax=Rhodanobacter denitrificans TaxID=666685 RepID=UPI00022D8075|nr:cytochrome b/b6 domain-containing protein [Rhodanobacter denitrificans]UJM85340.1 hypothetical protein LRJ86_11170 [Rhodanobacter denitrificans]
MHATVKVWDPLVRVFHWSLAGLFLANFFTEDGELVHRGIGYAVLALLAVRFVWGWVGTRHARFADVSGHLVCKVGTLGLRSAWRPRNGHRNGSLRGAQTGLEAGSPGGTNENGRLGARLWPVARGQQRSR